MSVTDQNGWGEVERRARQHEVDQLSLQLSQAHQMFVTITTEDRLRGTVVEALSQLEQGHPAIAKQILNDSLKIGGVK